MSYQRRDLGENKELITLQVTVRGCRSIVTVGECTQYTENLRLPCRPSGVENRGKSHGKLCIAYEGGLFLIESSYMRPWVVIREGYARMMGWEWVFFARIASNWKWSCGPREWVTCGSVPWLVMKDGNWMQTIVPPERAYVGDRP